MRVVRGGKGSHWYVPPWAVSMQVSKAGLQKAVNLPGSACVWWGEGGGEGGWREEGHAQHSPAIIACKPLITKPATDPNPNHTTPTYALGCSRAQGCQQCSTHAPNPASSKHAEGRPAVHACLLAQANVSII